MDRRSEGQRRAGWMPPPKGWSWVSCPGRLLAEESLRITLQGYDWGLIRREEQGFFLAFSWDTDSPFPIPPLFCLARVERVEGRLFLIFRFSPRGRPELRQP